jgi:hypothetical protein
MIQGRADAEATAVYADAYNQSPQAREFYTFTQTLDTYRAAFDRETTLLLSTEGGVFHLFKGPGTPPAMVPRSVPPAPPAVLKKPTPVPVSKSKAEPQKTEPAKAEVKPELKPDPEIRDQPKDEIRTEASVPVEPELPQRRGEVAVKPVQTSNQKKTGATPREESDLNGAGLVPSSLPESAPARIAATPTPKKAAAATPVAVRPRPLSTPVPVAKPVPSATPVSSVTPVPVPAVEVAPPAPEQTSKPKAGLLQLFQKKSVKPTEPVVSGDGSPAP